MLKFASLHYIFLVCQKTFLPAHYEYFDHKYENLAQVPDLHGQEASHKGMIIIVPWEALQLHALGPLLDTSKLALLCNFP